MTNLSRALSLPILTVALAACGSGGGDSPTTQTVNNTKPQTPTAKPSIDQSASQKLTLTLINMPDDSVKRLYELPYSTVTGITQTKLQANGYTGEVTDIQISGTPTLESALPKMGKVVYHGEAFNERTDPVEGTIGYGTSPGSLEYTIDFDERTGHGKISALQLDFGDIMLRQGKLEKINLDGQEVMGVRSNVDFARSGNPDNPEYAPAGNYELGVFGPNADSIAGKLKNSAFDIGFGGTRDGK